MKFFINENKPLSSTLSSSEYLNNKKLADLFAKAGGMLAGFKNKFISKVEIIRIAYTKQYNRDSTQKTRLFQLELKIAKRIKYGK